MATFIATLAAMFPSLGGVDLAPPPEPLAAPTPQVVTRRHRRHRKPRPRPMHPALASWYGDHGTGACGVGDVQGGYRFASLFLRCGTLVRFCYQGRCANGVMSDHGPYVSGRTFDLNYNLRAALACADLCYLRYRVGG
jgi:hypothetical protein